MRVFLGVAGNAPTKTVHINVFFVLIACDVSDGASGSEFTEDADAFARAIIIGVTLYGYYEIITLGFIYKANMCNASQIRVPNAKNISYCKGGVLRVRFICGVINASALWEVVGTPR